MDSHHPVSELAYRCVESWLNIADSRYAEGMLPTEGFQARYRRLTDSDAEQSEWDSFCDDLRDEAADMDMEYLAAWFIDLNKSVTVSHVLRQRDGKRYLDSECEYAY